MLSRKTLPRLILSCFLVLDILLISTWLKYSANTRLMPSKGLEQDGSYKNLSKNLNSLITQRGVNSTLNILREALQKKHITMNQCHSLTHLVGHRAYSLSSNNLETLLDSVNKSNLQICGGAFPHGIEAEIAINNNSPVNILNDLCDKLTKISPGFPCYHGAGHAFMHDSLDVNKSLLNCDKLPNSGSTEEWSNCYTGVFSEYAFQLDGVDGDTGLPFPSGPKIRLPMDNPMDFCQSLSEKYQSTCASQLGREFNTMKIDNPFAECNKSSYSPNIKTSCLRIVSAVIAQREFNQSDTLKVPPYILTLSSNLRVAYLEGVAGEYQAFLISGVTKDWKPICNSFVEKEDIKLCKRLMGGS